MKPKHAACVQDADNEASVRRDAIGPEAFARYRADPVAYARDVLRAQWWDRQIEVAQRLIQHRRVFVKASHSVGKSFLAGGLVNWFFDCFDPSFIPVVLV